MRSESAGHTFRLKLQFIASEKHDKKALGRKKSKRVSVPNILLLTFLLYLLMADYIVCFVHCK